MQQNFWFEASNGDRSANVFDFTWIGLCLKHSSFNRSNFFLMNLVALESKVLMVLLNKNNVVITPYCQVVTRPYRTKRVVLLSEIMKFGKLLGKQCLPQVSDQ